MTPKQQVFNLRSLHLVQGLEHDFDAVLATMVRDCRERPGRKRIRKMGVTLQFEPDTNGEDVIVSIQTSNSLPTRVAERYKMMATVKNGLKFSPGAPMRPEQTEMDFEPEE